MHEKTTSGYVCNTINHQVNGKEHMKEDHRLYSAWVVEQGLQLLKDGGDMDEIATLKYPNQTVIRTMEIYETIWACPDEEHMELTDYVEEHGSSSSSSSSSSSRR